MADTPSAKDRMEKGCCDRSGPLRAHGSAGQMRAINAGDNIEIWYPICGTAWVPERPYVSHDPTAWWGVQETASADLLGFALLDTSLLARLDRGATHSK